MIHRLSQVLLALAVAAVPALVASEPATAEARGGLRISVPSRFSPNGDGVQDDVRITIRVAADARVRLEIGAASQRTLARRVDLGVLTKGVHTWTWNGRNQSGKVVTDRAYRVRASTGTETATDQVQVDTRFEPVLLAPTYGADAGAAARVYPRTTVVPDTLPLSVVVDEKKIVDLELVIRDARGRVVRRANAVGRLTTTTGEVYALGRTVEWAAMRGGRPLPPGRYSAVAVGADLAGNSGRSVRVPIWVSADRLVWKEASTTVTPAETRFGPCEWSTANGCGDQPDCGTVAPSALYVGGLSYRSAACPTGWDPVWNRALGSHLLEVPEATGVRGLAAVRVSFTGAPTTAGEPDTGVLTVAGGTDGAGPTVTGTSGQSGWVEDPAWGVGLTGDDVLPQRDPAALWSFATTGTDSVDVASFTVDVRYLAVAG